MRKNTELHYAELCTEGLAEDFFDLTADQGDRVRSFPGVDCLHVVRSRTLEYLTQHIDRARHAGKMAVCDALDWRLRELKEQYGETTVFSTKIAEVSMQFDAPYEPLVTVQAIRADSLTRKVAAASLGTPLKLERAPEVSLRVDAVACPWKDESVRPRLRGKGVVDNANLTRVFGVHYQREAPASPFQLNSVYNLFPSAREEYRNDREAWLGYYASLLGGQLPPPESCAIRSGRPMKIESYCYNGDATSVMLLGVVDTLAPLINRLKGASEPAALELRGYLGYNSGNL